MNQNGGEGCRGEISSREISLQLGERKSEEQSPGHLLQFYSKNLEKSSSDSWLEKWRESIKRQLVILGDIFTYCNILSEMRTVTTFKVIFGIFASVILFYEYNKQHVKYMKMYLIVGIYSTISYTISIILLNIARYKKNLLEVETCFDWITTAFYYINALWFILISLAIFIMVTQYHLYSFYFYFYFLSLILIILTDSLGWFILTIPLFILFLLQYIIYSIISIIRSCCKRRIIVGRDCAPTLNLKEYEHSLEGGIIVEGTYCPICLEELEIGEHVVFMPCGKEHIFHKHCIQSWLNANSVCPTCRAEFEYSGGASELSSPFSTPTHTLHVQSNVGSHTQRPLQSNITHEIIDLPRNNLGSQGEDIEHPVTLNSCISTTLKHHSFFLGQLVSSKMSYTIAAGNNLTESEINTKNKKQSRSSNNLVMIFDKETPEFIFSTNTQRESRKNKNSNSLMRNKNILEKGCVSFSGISNSILDVTNSYYATIQPNKNIF